MLSLLPSHLSVVSLLIISAGCDSFASGSINKVPVLITAENDEVIDSVKDVVERYGLKYSRRILSTVLEYETTKNDSTKKILKEIKLNAHGFIRDIYLEQPIIIPLKKPRNKLSRLFKRSFPELLECSRCYGMDIMRAWALGYRGKGITVGVVDTGVEVTHVDLAPNIDRSLSCNFVKGQSRTDVNPKILPSYPEFDIYADHGNNCAGLIASVQGNQMCSSGVAPNASIAVLKFLELNDPAKSISILNFRPSALVEALVYKKDKIDIYSNSYGPVEDFTKSSVVVEEALKIGTTQGRNGSGCVYVVAAGNKGHFKDVNLDGYANSPYTIAISSVGVDNTIPDFGQPGACIMASTYGEGINKFDRQMMTTSHRNSCTDEFKRTSASAAIASGVIALVLEANPSLTWRDVQHLIVNTSSVIDLESNDMVTKNSAGFKYHRFFGFGIINASALVTLAKGWTNVPEQKLVKASTLISERKSNHTASADICKDSPNCLAFAEHVVAYIEFTSNYDKAVELELCSPTNTCSTLLTKQHPRQLSPTKHVLRKWKFLSLQFWGEDPNGTWVLKMFQNTTGMALKDKRFSIMVFNLTVYGYTDNDYSAGLYEELTRHIDQKIDEIADVLDVDISDETKGSFYKMLTLIGQMFIGAGSAALLVTIWCFLPVKTGLHIRQSCLEKCRQLWNIIKTTYMRVIRRVNINE